MMQHLHNIHDKKIKLKGTLVAQSGSILFLNCLFFVLDGPMKNFRKPQVL